MNTIELSNQVIEQADIVEIVSEFVSLVPKGNNFLGLCPFHADNHPSMSVSRSKKIFKCFSCNAAGNVITFYSKYNNLTYGQATVALAKKLGIKVDENLSKDSENKARLYKVMAEANNFYRFYLNNSLESKDALEYLNNRFITKEIIDEFEIGLAPSAQNDLYLSLKNQNINDVDQIELGLINSNNNDVYDLFRQRIMFPIHNHLGNVVGFSGRIYQKNSKEQAKYVNSKETAIFHKGNILYNFHKASKVARLVDCFYLFEGFMDVIAAYKADIRNGIATMGTALTNEHVKSIIAITKNVILCFDGDAAGIKALIRSVSIFSEFGIIPKAIILPDDLDPDEYYNKFGKDALKNELSSNAKNAYDVLYDYYLKSLDKYNISSIENFKRNVFEFLSSVKQKTLIDFYLKKLANDLDVEQTIIDDDFKKFSNNNYNYSYKEIIQPKVNNLENKISGTISLKYVNAFKQIIACVLKSSYFLKIYQKEMDQYASYSSVKDLSIYNGIINEITYYYQKLDALESNFMYISSSKLKDLFPEDSKEYLICKEIMTNNVAYDAKNNMRDKSSNDEYVSDRTYDEPALIANCQLIKEFIFETKDKIYENSSNLSDVEIAKLKLDNLKKRKKLK